MLLHTDMPTRAQVDRLLTSRSPASVSIYVSTDPVSTNEGERIELGNLAGEALGQLRDAGIAKREVSAIEEEIGDLIEDEGFWRHQARSLAIFATPEGVTTFRLPNRLLSAAEVSDRFHVKPLLRAVTVPQVALVLALAQGSVRLIEVSPDVEPAEVRVPDDLRGRKPLTWRDDVIGPVLYQVIGVTPVPLSAPEVIGALGTGAVDVLGAPALAVEHTYTGKGVHETWNDAGRRGAYLGSFEAR